MTESVLKDVQLKLKELQDIVTVLPQGYQYKVRELSACIETVVEMYDDIQRGVIPDILKEMRNADSTDENEVQSSQAISLANIEL